VAWSFVLEDKPPMATELVLKELQNETKLGRWTHCRPWYKRAFYPSNFKWLFYTARL